MKNHHQLSDTEKTARRLSLNRVFPYVIGSVLPLPILMIIGFVLLVVQNERIGDSSFVCVWITTMAVGLVCSVQSCRLAPNLSIALFGAIFVVIYFLGIWSLAILNM